MSNTKGNQYPLWYINKDEQVFAVDIDQNIHQMSATDFAMAIDVSEDGTVWVLSTEPDPDGGGAKIYWSNGDDNWNEIATTAPGGTKLTAASGSTCMYLTSHGDVYTLDTNGTATLSYSGYHFIEMAYGGGYFWAVMPERQGGIPVLRFTQLDDTTKSWTTFKGKVSPFAISVSYNGDCYGVNRQNSPVYYAHDGSTMGSAGSGADGIALGISFRNWNYLLTSEIEHAGNVVYKWEDIAGGTYQATNVRAIKVASSYYSEI